MGQSGCKVTIIVPIYNMENFLRDCLDSLAAQTMDPDKMEVLLINDGSKDQSAAIMEEFASRYPYMKAFHKENEGLSMTRNYGILRAKGKYIMYLDADDTLAPETVESVTDFFDKHYEEVDLVAYPEIPVINGQLGKPHFRYNSLEESGVFDLNLIENAFVNQTRINICIKNLFENNVLFELDRSFRQEDQKYCTEVLRRKMKIGYCAKGKYFYLHQQESIVRTFFHAYYIFESTMAYWEGLFSSYPDEVPKYIQALYLNDISWKTVSNILYPYHYEQEKLEQAKKRLIALLDRVSDDVILRHPGVDNFHRHYYISLKSGNETKMITSHPFGNEVDMAAIVNHDEIVLVQQKIEIVLCDFKVVGNKIKLLAFLKSAIFNYMGKPALYVVKNKRTSKAQEIPLRESSWGYYRTREKSNHFWLFNYEVEIKNLRSFEFLVDIDGSRFHTRFYFMPNVYFNHSLKRYLYYKDGMEYFYSNGVFQVNKADPEKQKKEKKNRLKLYFKSNKKAWLIRNLCSLKIKRYENVWLYHDCKGVEKDNAYYQFLHDFDKQDGVRRYYVVNDDLDRVKKLFTAKQRKYLVRFGSWKHKYLFLKARKILTAYIEKGNYLPFNDHWRGIYLDVGNQAEVIYLQHGILHAHSPWKYSLDRVVAREVVSTEYEKKNLVENYCFRPEDLIPCGMARFDFMDPAQGSVNRVLFAPSWRKYLVGMSGGEWVTTESKFIGSKYFEETSAFLNSRALHDLLEEYDLYLDFKLHPILKRYQHLYRIENDRVSMAGDSVEETQYKVFITDFSSFVFDFVYLEKPIVYFLPDDEMFRSGMHDYREIDIPFEDAFGDLALTAEEAVECLRKVLKNQCIPEKKYSDRMKQFFLYKDNRQRERLYQALTGSPDQNLS